MDLESVQLELDLKLAELNAILINFAKAPNRNYSRKFIFIDERKQSENNI